MKKVLLIGYPFPLRRGGSPRLLGLAKCLPEFGWQPIILTAPLDEKPDGTYKIVETDYRNALGFWIRLFRLNPDEDIRKQVKQRFNITAKKSPLDRLLTLAGEIVNYPDSDKGWKPFAIEAGDKIMRQECIEAIISSSAPVTGHIVARELKSRYKIPWLADLRDLWTQNHNYSYSALRRLVDKRLELKTLAKADALVTVSQPWADKLSMLHKSKVTYAITNGFDPETVNIPPVNLVTKFTIVYTGRIYPEKQDLTRLFTALSNMLSDKIIDPGKIEIRFYGPSADWLGREIEQYGLSSVVNQYGMVPRDVALQKQRESQLLLLLDWDDPQEKGSYPGKVFEYLGARRPILATGGIDGNVVGELLAETKAGIRALTVEDIKNRLEELYREYTAEDKIAYQGEESQINKYSHREMARKFSDILDNLVAR